MPTSVKKDVELRVGFIHLGMADGIRPHVDEKLVF